MLKKTVDKYTECRIVDVSRSSEKRWITDSIKKKSALKRQLFEGVQNNKINREYTKPFVKT